MMAVRIVNAHVLLDATRARAISAVGRAGGSCTCHGGNSLFRSVPLDSQIEYITRKQGMQPSHSHAHST